VLIDCPPSLGILTVNALTATDGVVIPVQCEYLALEGLSQLSRAVGLVRRALNPALQLRGLVMTMYDSRTTLSRQVVEEVHRHFPGRVFKAIIPRSVRLSEAPSYGEPIISYAPRSAGALAYASLARELLVGDGRLHLVEVG
jgi:chromosome partitioning protein